MDAQRIGAALAVNAAVGRLLRWTGRPEVRRELLGPAGRGLSPTDVRLLGVIGEQGPVRSSDLAAGEGVDRSTITVQVRRLEDRGLVARTPDQGDRRVVLLSLTPRGAQVRRRLDLAGAAVVDRVMAGWDPADREALAALLTRFTADLRRPDAI